MKNFSTKLFILAVDFFEKFHFVAQNTVGIIFQNTKTTIKAFTSICPGCIINKTWLEGSAKTVLIYTKICSLRLIPQDIVG